MYTTSCFCGAELAGESRDDQVRAGVAHFGSDHPQFDLTAVQIRNYLERVEQLAEPGQPIADLDPAAVEIVELGPDRVDDVLAFFDRDAFADNGGWASCYCIAHHAVGAEASGEWGERTWRQNRDELAARIEAGTTTGCLAYVDGRLVGWCNASRRSAFPTYACGQGDDEVGVTACFVIARAYRGHGIASRLLDRACEQFARDGLVAVEAHPATDPPSEASAYRGPLEMYRAAGFVRIDEAGPGCDGGRTVCVRRTLQ